MLQLARGKSCPRGSGRASGDWGDGGSCGRDRSAWEET